MVSVRQAILTGVLLIGIAAVASPSRSPQRKPVGEEVRLSGILRSVNHSQRTAVVEVDTKVDSGGREFFYGRPAPVTIRFERTSFITKQTSPSRWLPLAEIGPGHPVQVLAMPTQEVMIARETLLLPLPGTNPLPPVVPPANPILDPDGVAPDEVVVPMVFPVLGRAGWSDTFLASRGGGTRRHLGQDIMGAKMLPLVACFDGVVTIRTPGNLSGNFLSLVGDNGWRANYIHINNDTPGTDDGLGTADFGFVKGITTGTRVVAGQIIGWLGDSGNAEETAPHLHFELWNVATGGCYNPAASLRAAAKITRPVANLIAPDFTPPAGSQRLDGVLRSIDLAKRTVTLDVVATVSSGGKAESITQPETLELELPEYLRWGSFADLASTQPIPASGTRVTLIQKGGVVTTALVN